MPKMTLFSPKLKQRPPVAHILLPSGCDFFAETKIKSAERETSRSRSPRPTNSAMGNQNSSGGANDFMANLFGSAPAACDGDRRGDETPQDPRLNALVERTGEKMGDIAVSGRYHRPPKHLEQDYDIDVKKILGSGYNGNVYTATRKGSVGGSGGKYAVKEFKLRGVKGEKRVELEQECEIFLQMDHPHVARLTDVYEEHDRLTLVMECMEGGELFDRVLEKKRFAEKDAAEAAQQMVRAINYIHSHNIVHRDIKLENWLYESKSTNHLKLIDFGFSKAWDPNIKMKMSCGTLSYVAPEVLGKSYTSQCDLWSLGVVVFILLSGYMPFSGSDDRQVKCIREGKYTFKEEKWKTVSAEGLDFVKKLMVVDPTERLTAENALKHKWFHIMHVDTVHEVDGDVVCSMFEFAQASKFRRSCMLAMAWSLSNEERAKVRQAFMDMDRNQQGTITLGEFKNVILEKFHLSNEKIEEVFNALDAAHNHEIQYSEFLAAMVSSRIDLHDDLMRSAFRRFDTDNSGFIDAANLKELLGHDCSEKEIAEMMEEVDANHDGKISYHEFIDYVRGHDAKGHHLERVDRFIDIQKEGSKDGVTDPSCRRTAEKHNLQQQRPLTKKAKTDS